MPASYLEFHVEEPSMEAFLGAWLPRLIPEDCSFEIHSYRGKGALLRNIGNRLRGYARWMPTEYRIVIVVDRDGDACMDLKSKLEDICRDAGLRSRRTAGSDWQVVTRIAIEELEAWYFGAWQAVCAAYPSFLKCREPESLPAPRCDQRWYLGSIRENHAETRVFQARAE